MKTRAMILTPFGALQFRTFRRWTELVEPTSLQRRGQRLLLGNHPETYYWEVSERANNKANGTTLALTCATFGISTKQGLHPAQRHGAHSCRSRCSVSSSQRSTKSCPEKPQGEPQSLKRRLRSPKAGFLPLDATSTLLWISSQPSCPEVSHLPDPTIAWDKFLKLHPPVHPSLHIELYWFCFAGEPNTDLSNIKPMYLYSVMHFYRILSKTLPSRPGGSGG